MEISGSGLETLSESPIEPPIVSPSIKTRDYCAAEHSTMQCLGCIPAIV
jgi:hypothetical protein